MSKPITNMSYYDFKNISHFANKELLSKGILNFRFLKNVINTKIGMFQYKDLPFIRSDYLETIMMFNNCLCLYKNDVLGGVVLCKYVTTELSEYNTPSKVDLTTISGKSVAEDVDFKDIVLVKDNVMDIPPFVYLIEWGEKLDKIETTLNAYLTLLRLPAVFTCDKKLLSTLNKLFEDAGVGKPFALGDKSLVEGFNQFDLKLPIEPENIIEVYKNYRNFTLQSMGISGSDTQKRERLLVGEVENQQQYTDYIYFEMVNCRENWIKEANEKFNLNIELVETRKIYTDRKIKELATQQKLSMGIQNKGDDNDGNGTDNEQ